jgi:F-type H+-transporting ATPase subunit b
MRFHAWTFVLQTTNFLVLVWLLRRFFWRRVLAAVDKRRQETERVLADAETARRTAATLHETLTRERAADAASRDAAVAAARTEADAARQQILARARSEVEVAMSTARHDIERERTLAEAELRERAAELGVALARRLLEAAEATGVTPRLLDEALDALPSVRDDHRLEIITARALSPAERARCLERLHDTDVTFAVDPSLIAGVELRFGSSILHHSWRAALADAQRELTDGHAR